METRILPSFDEFVSDARAQLRTAAQSYRLPLAEVHQIAYIAYSDAKATYRADHPSASSFRTYAIGTLKRMVRANSDRHQPLEAIEQGEWRAHPLEERLYYEVTPEPSSTQRVAPDPEQLIVTLLAQHCEQLAFADVLRGHPAYSNPTHRAVMDAVLAFGDRPDAVALIAEQVGLSRRRVYQLLIDIGRCLQERDVLALDKQVVLGEDGTACADPIRYRPLDGLTYRSAHQLELPKLLHVARRLLNYGQVVPVVIDQYLRVLVDEETCAAAQILGFEAVKTLMHVVREGTHESDDVLASLRAGLGAARGAHDYDIDVIDSLRRRVANGSLSTLVAARIAHLPRRIQEHVAGQLGGVFVCVLTIKDANELVAAYDPEDKNHAARFAAFLQRKVQQIASRICAGQAAPGEA